MVTKSEVYSDILRNGLTWRGQESTIYIKDDSDSSELAMGALQEADIEMTDEIEELDEYAGATMVLDHQVTSKKFTWSMSVAAWDNSAFKQLFNWNDTDTSIDWTPAPQYIELVIKIQGYGESSSETIWIEFDNPMLETRTMPIDPADWSPLEIDGMAQGIADIYLSGDESSLPTWHPDYSA